MSILSGYGKFKRYVLTDNGYKLCSQWTSSNTVYFDDGNTAQTKVGAINGITDSLTATNSSIALSAAAGKNLQDQVTTLNTGLFGARTYATYNPSNPRLALKNIILPDAFRQHDNNNYFVSVAMESEADAAYAVCFVEKHTGAFNVYFRRNDGTDWGINTAVWFSYTVVINR